MNKSRKVLFIFLITLLLAYNIHYSFLTFYCASFNINTIKDVIIRAVPLIIAVIYYLSNIHSSNKLSINFICLFISISIFIIIKIHKLLYFYLLINAIDNTFLFIMNILFILFMFLAFFKNFKRGESIVLYSLLIFPIFLILQFAFEIMNFGTTDFYTYTNPNRYEFVKYHYFSEYSFLPDKIPEDATNIVFRYNSYLTNIKDLYLEYDSPSIKNDEHHIIYEIPSKIE